MDFYAARQRRPPEPVDRGWPRHRGLPPPPPPPPPPPRRPPLPPPRHPAPPRRGGGERGGASGGGMPERGVPAVGAQAAAASGGKAAAVAGELVGDGAAAGAAAPVAARGEETGGGEGAGGKRRLPLASSSAYPPPKRRAVSARRRFPPGCGRDVAAPPLAGAGVGSRCGDARDGGGSGALLDRPAAAPLAAASEDGARSGAASPGAAGPSVLSNKVSASGGARLGGVSPSDVPKEVSASDGAAPVADGCHRGQDAGVLKSSEAFRQSGVAVPDPDGLLDTGSQGVAAALVEGSAKETRSSGELWRKEVVPHARLQAKPRRFSAVRRFPPGCGRDSVLSVLVGGGIGEVRFPSETRPADDDLDVSEEEVATDGCTSAVHRNRMEIVPPPCNDAFDGAVQDDELEEGEIPPEFVVQASLISTSVTLHKSASCGDGASLPVTEVSGDGASLPVTEVSGDGASLPVTEICGDGASLPVPEIIGDGASLPVTEISGDGASLPVTEISAMGTSPVQPSNEKTGGNTLQCGEKRLSLGDGTAGVQGANTADNANAGVQGDCTAMRNKVLFTPRKIVKPTKVIQKSTLGTQHRPFPEYMEETRIGRPVELTTDHVVQAPMSSDKCPITQEKELHTTRDFFGPRKKVKVKDLAHLPMKVSSASGSKGKLHDKEASKLEDDDILKAVVVHEGNLELHLNSSSGALSLRCQRQYGSRNGDARSKFKMLCRRFEFICRALAQAVEKRSVKIKRIDLEADKAIRRLPGFTKPDPIVGEVPGVEVGDEFLYRVQLAIVGLHRPYQGGIDTTKHRNGMLIAISIVASGGYPDELPCSGELIYTGSGGKPAGKKDNEDQKLERGNLALKNCIRTKTPVRVIHGFKAQSTEGGTHSRAKQVSTFVYDGLYRVVDFWIDGRQGSRVFKYKLQKIPGQPELPMHIAKGLRKSKMRPGLCMADISQGKEGTPICVINTVDDVRPAPFRYITRIKYPFGLTKMQHQGCDCTNGCAASASCACAVKNGGEIPFSKNGAIVDEKPLIFECGPSCTCPPSCQNRVTQHGMKIPLEVFRTSKTGWGVRSLRSISSGSFICEYVGELLQTKEADKRRNSDYLFDIGLDASSSYSQTMGDVDFTIDAADYGNIGRFINHSCSPNLYTQNVLWDHDDKRMPHIMFFAAETIPPLQELTYDYNYEIDYVQDVNGKVKFKVCQCGSPQCCGRLY